MNAMFRKLFSSPTKAKDKPELQVLQGNGQFATNLYKILAEKEGNVFFSPISIHAVLSMAYQGAQGTTAQHLASTLKVSEPADAAEGYQAIMKRLNNVENVTLLMANKIFLMVGFTMSENFKTAVTKNFMSEVQLVNFGENAVAAKTINDWVEEQTRNKIKNLISKSDLNDSTRLVFVNAIYFKGNWLHQFEKICTQTKPFYLNDKNTVDMQMMNIREEFRYKNDNNLDAQVLELPYTNGDLSMIIILPNKRNGIQDLEKKLATINLTIIANKMRKVEVDVALPKFKIEQTIDLEDSLTKLGLGEMFNAAKANFKGMIENPDDLYVSKVVHKAFIEMNEEGAEAAAATGMMMVQCSATLYEPPVRYFIADHPFIFLISERSENHLFMGRISKF